MATMSAPLVHPKVLSLRFQDGEDPGPLPDPFEDRSYTSRPVRRQEPRRFSMQDDSLLIPAIPRSPSVDRSNCSSRASSTDTDDREDIRSGSPFHKISAIVESSSPSEEMYDGSTLLRQLSEEDLRFVQESWGFLKPKMKKIGIRSFLIVFKQCPETKDIFYCAQKRTTSNICKDAGFKSHAKRFMEVLDMTVEYILSPNPNPRTLTILHNIGHYHTRLRTKGFRQEYWFILADAQLQVILQELDGHCTNMEKATDTWKIVIEFATMAIRHGFLVAAEKRKSIVVRARSVPPKTRHASFMKTLSRLKRLSLDAARSANICVEPC